MPCTIVVVNVAVVSVIIILNGHILYVFCIPIHFGTALVNTN